MPFSKTGYQWRAHNIAATLQKTDAKQNRGLNHEAVNARVVKAMNSEMEVEDSSDPIEELRIEIASLRLKLRAVMTYLACVRDGFAGDETLAQVGAFLEGSGMYAVPADQMDPIVRDAASFRARERMVRMACDLGRLPIAPVRRKSFGTV